MYCSKCGSQNQDGSKFCSNCSNPLNIVTQPVQQPVLPYVQQPFQQPVQQYTQPPMQPVLNSPRKSILVPVLIGIIALIVVLVIVFFVWAAMSPDAGAATDTTKAQETTVAATSSETPAATTAATTTAAPAATSAPAQATQTAAQATTTFIPDPEVVYADSPKNAVRMVQQMMNDTGYEFYREEFFIDNGDGTLSIDINTPEAADTPCYVVVKSGSDGGYYNCFMVKENSGEIYAMPSEDSGILVRING